MAESGGRAGSEASSAGSLEEAPADPAAGRGSDRGAEGIRCIPHRQKLASTHCIQPDRILVQSDLQCACTSP